LSTSSLSSDIGSSFDDTVPLSIRPLYLISLDWGIAVFFGEFLRELLLLLLYDRFDYSREFDLLDFLM
jgi:hypothetical protein